MAGVTAALTIGGGALSAIGKMTEGVQGFKVGQANAAIYEAQAKNIAAAQAITAEQYRTKANVLRGEATTMAARNGVKISGSTANSISQSIMQIQMDNAYNQYNLEVKKQEAFSNASLERYKGRGALFSGFVGAGVSALSAGKDYYEKYWNGSSSNSNSNWLKNKVDKGTTWVKGQTNKIKNRGSKLSGGLPTTNWQTISSSDMFV